MVVSKFIYVFYSLRRQGRGLLLKAETSDLCTSIEEGETRWVAAWTSLPDQSGVEQAVEKPLGVK
jgi:hypothetical protein